MTQYESIKMTLNNSRNSIDSNDYIDCIDSIEFNLQLTFSMDSFNGLSMTSILSILTILHDFNDFNDFNNLDYFNLPWLKLLLWLQWLHDFNLPWLKVVLWHLMIFYNGFLDAIASLATGHDCQSVCNTFAKENCPLKKSNKIVQQTRFATFRSSSRKAWEGLKNAVCCFAFLSC